MGDGVGGALRLPSASLEVGLLLLRWRSDVDDDDGEDGALRLRMASLDADLADVVLPDVQSVLVDSPDDPEEPDACLLERLEPGRLEEPDLLVEPGLLDVLLTADASDDLLVWSDLLPDDAER